MHQLRCTNNVTAIHMTNCLMPQAHTEHRGVAGERANRIADDAGLFGTTWAWRQQHAIGLQGHGLIDGQLIVAHHDGFGTKFTQVLHDVVDEAVITIDNEDPGHVSSLPCFIPFRETNCPRGSTIKAWLQRRSRAVASPQRADTPIPPICTEPVTKTWVAAVATPRRRLSTRCPARSGCCGSCLRFSASASL